MFTGGGGEGDKPLMGCEIIEWVWGRSLFCVFWVSFFSTPPSPPKKSSDQIQRLIIQWLVIADENVKMSLFTLQTPAAPANDKNARQPSQTVRKQACASWAKLWEQLLLLGGGGSGIGAGDQSPRSEVPPPGDR